MYGGNTIHGTVREAILNFSGSAGVWRPATALTGSVPAAHDRNRVRK